MAIKPIDDDKTKRIQLVGKKFMIFALVIGLGIVVGVLYQSLNKAHGNKTLVQGTHNLNLNKNPEEIQSATANLVKGGMQSVTKNVEQVLGIATGFMQNAASQSSQLATGFIFDKTMGNILKQFNKLPVAQQKEIRQYICK